MQRATTALFTRAAYSAAALSLLNVAALAVPDRIYQSDGSILEDVTVVEEGLSTVSYKPSGSKKAKTVDSELVLSIEFSNKPEEVSTADVDASQEAFGSALAGMENYLANLGSKKDKKFPWAANYARFRIIELNALMNDQAALIASPGRGLGPGGGDHLQAARRGVQRHHVAARFGQLAPHLEGLARDHLPGLPGLGQPVGGERAPVVADDLVGVLVAQGHLFEPRDHPRGHIGRVCVGEQHLIVHEGIWVGVAEVARGQVEGPGHLARPVGDDAAVVVEAGAVQGLGEAVHQRQVTVTGGPQVGEVLVPALALQADLPGRQEGHFVV